MQPEAFKAEWEKHFDDAQRLFDAGDTAGAEKQLAACARMSPEIWCGLGQEAIKNKEPEMAINRFREAFAYATAPKTKAICLNNIGSVLAGCGHRQEARGYFVKSIELCPDYADAYANIALCHKWRGECGPALEWLDKALTINPHHQLAAFTKALVLLLSGDWIAGWEAFESRWRMKKAAIRKLAIPWPEWDGTNAKRVLIYGEQGIGDNIQMMRYAIPMRENGIEVSLMARTPLKSLCQWSGLFAHVCSHEDNFPPFDAHIPIFSLPRVFKTTPENIPAGPGYIKRPPLSEVLELGSGMNIGIFWAGAAAYEQNLFRSTHLIQWRRLLEMENITWHSLQVGVGEDEALMFPRLKVYPTPADYLETAKRIAGMDLVITIDTSVAHLAAAMAVPTWILLPRGCDYRWLLDKEDTPWYESAKLFRAPDDFAWEPVFDKIATLL